MAKKTVTLRALGRIDYNGGVYIPGTENDTFECDQTEAKRLKADCVAVDATAAAAGPTAAELKAEQEAAARAEEEAAARAELLAKVAAASTVEELEALLPEDEPPDQDFALQLHEAFNARAAELSEQ